MHSIAITNQKGGVGKTTSSVNLGAALARLGQRVCLVDLDPQAHLTMHLGLEPGQAKPSVYELLGGSASLEEAVRTVRPNVDLVPAEIDLAGAEVELVGVVGRETLLRDALDPVRDRYDVLLIDCPPSLGLLTINALSAVEEVFITLQPHFLALQGLGKLLETVSLVQRRVNDRLRISAVVFCLYDSRTALCSEVAAEVNRFFQSDHPLKSLWQESHIFQTQIRRNIRLAEAPGHGQTIFEYASSSHGAQDYMRLAKELLAVWEGNFDQWHKQEEGSESARRAAAETALSVAAITQADDDGESRAGATEPAEASEATAEDVAATAAEIPERIAEQSDEPAVAAVIPTPNIPAEALGNDSPSIEGSPGDSASAQAGGPDVAGEHPGFQSGPSGVIDESELKEPTGPQEQGSHLENLHPPSGQNSAQG